MKFPVYAVRDSLIGFGMPLLRDNDSVASRAFEHDITRDDFPYKTHPQDYQLYRIGIYDTDNGVLEATPVELIASAIDFI